MRFDNILFAVYLWFYPMGMWIYIYILYIYSIYTYYSGKNSQLYRHTLWYFYEAMENGPFSSMIIFRMVIFHSRLLDYIK
jgi:hypothetical protein